MDFQATFLGIIGVVLLVRPNVIAAPLAQRRQRRLSELQSGAKETYFEERRSLEAYVPPRRMRTWRLLGVALVALAAAAFVWT